MNHLRTHQNPIFSETKSPRLAFKTRTNLTRPNQIRQDQTIPELQKPVGHLNLCRECSWSFMKEYHTAHYSPDKFSLSIIDVTQLQMIAKALTLPKKYPRNVAFSGDIKAFYDALLGDLSPFDMFCKLSCQSKMFRFI